MRPLEVTVHNVRGALDVTVHLRPFSALIGPNNAGKTTLLDAVRLFYGALEWDEHRDRPWNTADDTVSWVEVVFEVSEEEADRIVLHTEDVELSEADRDSGVTNTSLLDGDRLRIRRYLAGDVEHAAGAYYFVPPDGGDPEPTQWDALAGKLGQCVYIPLSTRTEEQTSGDSSPLRDVLVMAFDQPVIDKAAEVITSQLQLMRAIVQDGPITRLEEDLDQALSPWQLSARVSLNEVSTDFIVRHLIDLRLQQDGSQRALESQGSGVQRALIAALIQAAARLRSHSDKNPFRWILFEEPEAFLHPAQVTRLAQNLRELTTSGNAAVTITTHDPAILSASETSPEGIVRIHRAGTRIRAVSPTPAQTASVLDSIHLRSAYARSSHNCFRSIQPLMPAWERARILYDLDARRAAAFFADRVIVVEGYSDTVLFEWLNRRGHLADRLGPNIGFLEAGGKFELHRVAATLTLFNIPHVVLWDEDAAMKQPGTNDHKVQKCRDKAALLALQDAVHGANTAFAGAVRLTGTIERWLGVQEDVSSQWKATNLGEALTNTYDDPASAVRPRVEALLDLLRDLFAGRNPEDYKKRPEFQGMLIERKLDAPYLDLTVEVASLPRSACGC
ncbi:ATP-dependent endonuclease [Spirillospora sp. NPDC127200]